MPFVYGALAAVIGFSGPGEWSLDQVLGLSWNFWWGVAALLAGLAAAVPPIVLRLRVLTSR